MKIVIGSSSPVGPPPKKETTSDAGVVEAKLLNLRPPRKRRSPAPEGSDKRKGARDFQDPATGRVVVLLIPEGHKIPKDLSSGDYRVFIRFAPR